jgi:hypothetical protein
MKTEICTSENTLNLQVEAAKIRYLKKSLADIDKQREQCERELQEYEAAYSAVSTSTREEREIAVLLHEKLCDLDHRIDCDWNFESHWFGNAHQAYLTLAKAMLELSSAETIRRVLGVAEE